MPIFKVTVKEEITRMAVAYVDAPDGQTADRWASNANPAMFRNISDDDVWGEVENVEQVDAAPDGWKVRTP